MDVNYQKISLQVLMRQSWVSSESI